MPADKDHTQDKLDFEDCIITIATSTTVSAAVDLRGMTLCGIYFPAAFTGTTITFQASADNVTFVPVQDGAGAAISKTIAQGQYLKLSPVDFAGIQYLKVVSGSAEAANRTMQLAIRPV